MRLLTIGLISSSLAVGACAGAASPPPDSGSRAAEPAAFIDKAHAPSNQSESGGDTSRVPVPTTGSTAGTAGIRAEWREVTIPAGTRLPVILETAVGSDTSHAEEPVSA